VFPKHPTPTQSTCLFYCHDNGASKCVCVSKCKTKGKIGIFQRYFNLLSKQASWLLFITTDIVDDSWSLDFGAVRRASIQDWKNNGAEVFILELLIFSINVMEIETPFSSTGQSTSDEKQGSINDWTYHFDMLHPKTSWHNVGTRPIFPQRSSNEFAGSQNKRLTWVKNRWCNSCTKLQRSMFHTWFPPFHRDSTRDDCFNFVEQLWCSRSWPQHYEKEKNQIWP
jgi:hypothetical protein